MTPEHENNPEPGTQNSKTIFALATPAHPSPLALIRVSGPLVPALARNLCGASMRRAAIDCVLELPVGDVPAWAWLLPGPHTLTGEDTLELRVPGNPAIVRRLEQRLRDEGARDAEPGEFTRRALEAGKLDLSRAEAVNRLINAGGDSARRQALDDLAGDTGAALAALAERLRHISARFEMLFDFTEEEHAEPEEADLARDLGAVTAELRELVGRGEMLPHRERPVVALFGPPNAGKSTLFNALVGAPRALVSELPGTTRDPVESDCNFGSHRAQLVDLSGVGSADTDRGRFAETARGRAIECDVLLVLDAPGIPVVEEFAELQRRDASIRARAVWVNAKSDVTAAAAPSPAGLEEVSVSAVSGAGLDELRRIIAGRLDQRASAGATSLMRVKAGEAAGLLEEIDADVPPEAVASTVRRALRLLDEALLSDAPGDVLDLIFSRFCIGK